MKTVLIVVLMIYAAYAAIALWPDREEGWR
jgi:hypothetical protein